MGDQNVKSVTELLSPTHWSIESISITSWSLKSKISECIAEDGGFSEVTSPTGTYKGIRQGCVFDGEMQYWNEFRSGLPVPHRL